MKAGYVIGGFISLAVVAMLSVPGTAAPPAGPAAKSDAVKLERIPDSTVKRITLSESAMKRLGIETGMVTKQPIVRKQMVGGLVVAEPEKAPVTASAGSGGSMFAIERAAGSAQPAAAPAIHRVAAVTVVPAASDAWMLVTLSGAEWDRLAKDRPARLLPLATRDSSGPELMARPSGLPPVEDTKRTMLKLYYVVPGKEHGLTPNMRMRVELQLLGDEGVRTVVPYGAVYYDATGAAWVYVYTAPRTFERHRIGIERVIGDLAVLSEGPPVKTAVVTVGAALLYGTEIFGK